MVIVTKEPPYSERLRDDHSKKKREKLQPKKNERNCLDYFITDVPNLIESSLFDELK